MSNCLTQFKEHDNADKDCSNDCTSYENKSCVLNFMTKEIREIYEILGNNKKKMDVLVQLNSYLVEVLHAEAEEAFVK